MTTLLNIHDSEEYSKDIHDSSAIHRVTLDGISTTTRPQSMQYVWAWLGLVSLLVTNKEQTRVPRAQKKVLWCH